MFLIIWGFRSKAKNQAMLQLECRNGHRATHRIVTVTRWFTLFYIPLIPVKKIHYSVCAACGTQLKLPKEAVGDLIASGTSPSPSPSPEAASASDPPAGWYPDPAGAAEQRYWDGAGWTEAVQPGPTAG